MNLASWSFSYSFFLMESAITIDWYIYSYSNYYTPGLSILFNISLIAVNIIAF